MVRDSLRKVLSVAGHTEDPEKRVRQLTALIEITKQLTSTLELEPLLQYILENAVKILDCEAGSLFLVDEGTQELVLKVAVGEVAASLLGQRLPPNAGIAGQAVQMRQPLIENDVQHSARYRDAWDQQTGFVTHSLIAVPMEVKDRVIGLIEVFNHRGDVAFTSDDQSLLTAFAGQVAVAIENARLYTDIQQELNERKKAEQALRNSEAIYRQAIEVAGAVPYYQLFSDKGWTATYEFVGDGIRQITGYGPEEFSATVWDELMENTVLVGDLAAYSVPEAVKLVRSGKHPIWQSEHRIHDRDGNIHWVLDAAVDYYDENGVSYGSVGMFLDITQRKQAEETLRAKEELYRTVVSHAPVVIFAIDEAGLFTLSEGTGLSNLGLQPGQVVGLSFYDVYRDVPAVIEGIESALKGNSQRYEASVQGVVFDTLVSPMFDAEGKVIKVIGVATDITERKRSDDALRASEEKFRELNVVLEKKVEERTFQLQQEKTKIERFAQDVQCLRALTNFLQACMTIQETGKIISDHMSNLFPLTDGSLFLAGAGPHDLTLLTQWGTPSVSDELDPATCWGLRRSRVYVRQGYDPSPRCAHYGSDAATVSSMCLPLLVQGDVVGLMCIEKVDQENNSPFTPEMQNLAIASADSIALALANLRLREKLHNQAIRDPLTGLFNKRFMEETLDREVHRAARTNHPLSIIMLEIDDFRIYNNTYGHEAGDYVLRKLSETIRSILRRSDFPCRYGGDEFTIILPDMNLRDAAQKAEQLRQSVQAMALSYDNQALGIVTISTGVASFPQHGDSGEAVLKMADAASYKAKDAGKNCVVVAE